MPRPAQKPIVKRADPVQKSQKRIRIANPYLGCTMIDPLTGEVYTHYLRPLLKPSSWVDAHMKLGNLVEA